MVLELMLGRKRICQPILFSALPNCQDDLTRLCLRRAMISEDMRLCPGRKMPGLSVLDTEPADGQYCLELIYPNTNEVIAVSGFYTSDSEMTISHTPQGASSDEISREARRSLFSEYAGFRDELIQTLIQISRGLQLKRIIGIAAVSNKKVIRNIITLGRGREIIDKVFEQNGFIRRGGYFFLEL